MNGVLTEIISAVTAAGIDCDREYCSIPGYESKKNIVTAYAGIRKVRFERLRNGISDISVQIRVTVQAFGADGALVQSAAEKKVIPAVMGCDEEIYGAEISEVKYEAKNDRVYCEVTFDVRRCGYDICN